ncbi:hypothetical protein QOT17_000728 [Balamuthia mandrillaris]
MALRIKIKLLPLLAATFHILAFIFGAVGTFSMEDGWGKGPEYEIGWREYSESNAYNDFEADLSGDLEKGGYAAIAGCAIGNVASLIFAFPLCVLTGLGGGDLIILTKMVMWGVFFSMVAAGGPLVGSMAWLGITWDARKDAPGGEIDPHIAFGLSLAAFMMAAAAAMLLGLSTHKDKVLWRRFT